MPTFFFRGERSDGSEVKGTREAEGKIALLTMLQTEGIKVSEMKEQSASSFSLSSISFFESVKTEEKIVLTRTLSAMLKAGLALSRALSVLEKQSANKLLKRTLVTVGDDVKRGLSLNEALAKHPKIFSTLYISMVKAGEESGTLSQSLSVITVQMERAHTLIKKVQSAMIYPSIIFSATIVIAILMLIFVVPTLTNTFAELGVELPATTQAIVSASNFLTSNAVLSLSILVCIIGAFAYALRTRWGHEAFSTAILYLPIVSPIVKETYTARTARTLASLLGAGVEVLRAIEITKEVVGHPGYARVVARVEEAVRKGEPIAKVFQEHARLYPILMSDMIAVGEETGGVADMLSSVAEFYEGEVEQKTKDLSTVIEPVLMLFIGGVVGVFALSMIAPIYSITENL